VTLGTHLPGWRTVGTFRTADGAAFYAVRSGRRCLTLDLGAGPYRRVVVEPDGDQDPVALAARIEAAR